ncbi:MAG: hypothetical protein OXI80_18045 [Caldilineaceae bacterium]|uniref:Uncharacterized protein n=1 Tax=Caldilineaceae bacterium SB0664_bin_27 TaxID=2605260 RepID=A0A6B0YUK9_9CHLR|nr:hypothetical protein [Caldilineaceae bacterium]MDE0339583.1 hypothetical protein [Caldilineaceae bacterium]MXY93679.1 hypothetical protein [Caldilineaceae bacterium SB0664_bin_27]
MANSAMFEGLVFDERRNAAQVKHVGERACYVVDEDGFLRHIDAAKVDQQVLGFLKGQVDEHRDLAVTGVMDLMGKDDIFTKAAVESSIDNIDQAVGQAIPEQSRQWLGMMGFRVIIDDQGEVVDIEMPAGEIDEDEY